MAAVRAALLRTVVIALVAGITFGLVTIRGAAPTTTFRLAAAPSPGGGFYIADPSSNRLLLFSRDGSHRTLGKMPGYAPLAMGVQGQILVVGSEQGLYRSDDGGLDWQRAGPRGVHFTAVAFRGTYVVAADWGRALWVSDDSGVTWLRADATASDLQVNNLLVDPQHAWLAATDVGILRSADKGRSWRLVDRSPDRATALYRDGSGLVAGTWDGRILASPDDGLTWSQQSRLPAGIWWISAGLISTATGLYENGSRATPPLSELETVQSARVDGSVFAVQPGPRLWLQTKGTWRKIYAG